ncbi:MAG: very short patch repair endonuclease [Paraburkholderia sp.]|uniref:very short patch repair endonuclease n=1 Tax=Paraburkholderia sp. TaxID=1926495 RepID=UPI00397DF885
MKGRSKGPLSKSEQMARVRTKDTAPELLLRRALWHAGIRYRLRVCLPGSPDLVVPGTMVAIFVDGCFWHGCPDHYKPPATNCSFWQNKLEKNRARDNLASQTLADQGWTVLRFWEHEVNAHVDIVLARVKSTLAEKKR